MRPSRVLVAFSAAFVLVLTGCNDDAEPDDSSAPTTESSTPTSTAPSTTSTPPSPEPSTSTPAPSPPASENAMPQACAVVTAQQMSDVLFVPVEQTLDDDGCRYAVPDDDTAPAVDFVQSRDITPDAFAQARDAAAQITGGQAQPVEDVGDEAFFVIGPDDSGQVTGLGGVLVGDTYVAVAVTQSQDLIEPEVGQFTIDAVSLAGDALGG